MNKQSTTTLVVIPDRPGPNNLPINPISADIKILKTVSIITHAMNYSLLILLERYWRDIMSQVQVEITKDPNEDFTDYRIDFLIADSHKSYYGIIDGLTIEPVWIPKSAVDKKYRIKRWFVDQYKSGKPTWKKIESKVVQKKLKHFINPK